jgi:hypothetical protein
MSQTLRFRSACNCLIAWITISLCATLSAAAKSPEWSGSPWFDEQSITSTIDDGVRIHVNAPLDKNGKPAKATRLIIYTLPAGNTIEQTLGAQMKPGLDWHYDIQHVAAQVRLLRTLDPNERIVLLLVEGPALSWSKFRAAHADADAKMARLVDQWRKEFGEKNARVFLTGHSNGGSFMFGVIDGNDEIPASIDRIAFLDSNYNFDGAKHAEKLARWLRGEDDRRLVVIAYDDREIMLNGKKVLGPTGGTFRATVRMKDALGQIAELSDSTGDTFQESTGLDGRVHFYVHPNPQNKILHTVLVGEMNGLVHAATLGTRFEEKWGTFGGPRAYTNLVQPEPTMAVAEQPIAEKARAPRPSRAMRRLPMRDANAVGGAEFAKSIEGMSLEEREAAILREILSGNFPDFLRTFKAAEIRGTIKDRRGEREVAATLHVMPDYLAVGSNRDFVRMPMTPQTAQAIADKFGCTLPTRKMVDAIDTQAELRIDPRPMTEEREAVSTFAEHDRIVREQFGSRPVGQLVCGIKKDIVLTPRIFERPQRLAIYGWRQLDGKPIQPLTIVHWDRYVDYSHGARMVQNNIEVDDKRMKISDVLEDPALCGLVSDEGPMKPARYSPN